MKKTKLQELTEKQNIKLLKADIKLLKAMNTILIDMSKIDNNIIETYKKNSKIDTIIILILIGITGLLILRNFI